MCRPDQLHEPRAITQMRRWSSPAACSWLQVGCWYTCPHSCVTELLGDHRTSSDSEKLMPRRNPPLLTYGDYD